MRGSPSRQGLMNAPSTAMAWAAARAKTSCSGECRSPILLRNRTHGRRLVKTRSSHSVAPAASGRVGCEIWSRPPRHDLDTRQRLQRTPDFIGRVRPAENPCPHLRHYPPPASRNADWRSVSRSSNDIGDLMVSVPACAFVAYRLLRCPKHGFFLERQQLTDTNLGIDNRCGRHIEDHLVRRFPTVDQGRHVG